MRISIEEEKHYLKADPQFCLLYTLSVSFLPTYISLHHDGLYYNNKIFSAVIIHSNIKELFKKNLLSSVTFLVKIQIVCENKFGCRQYEKKQSI